MGSEQDAFKSSGILKVSVVGLLQCVVNDVTKKKREAQNSGWTHVVRLCGHTVCIVHFFVVDFKVIVQNKR